MLRIGYEFAGFAATTSTTKGGEDTLNPSSVETKRDSLRYSDDGSQGSESDNSSEDQRSNEDGGSTSTEESSGHPSNFDYDYSEEKVSIAETSRVQFQAEFKTASFTVRNEVFRLRNENKDLRGQICDARTELNKVGKFSRSQRSLITRLEDELQDLREQSEVRDFRYESAAISATEAKKNLATIKSQIQELRATGDKVQEVLRQKEVELQQSLEELRKLQATKDREEHKSVQEPSAAQELQLAKMAQDLRKELEMDQLRESIRKLTEDYKSLQGPGATRELRQAEIDHGSSGEELKQIKSILEKLTRDHEQLRDAVQGTSPRPNEAAKPIGQSAESRADCKKAKDSRSNHAAMHVDVQGSALDRVHSAVQKNIARQERIRATGRKWIPSPRRQIYIGNIAFDATADDVMWAINDLTHNRVYDCTMPRSGDRNRGYAFVTIAWPSEFVGGVDMDTFCEAIYRLDIKGRPIYAKEAHHRDE